MRFAPAGNLFQDVQCRAILHRRAKKGHGKSLRRHTMTFILKRGTNAPLSRLRLYGRYRLGREHLSSRFCELFASGPMPGGASLTKAQEKRVGWIDHRPVVRLLGWPSVSVSEACPAPLLPGQAWSAYFFQMDVGSRNLGRLHSWADLSAVGLGGPSISVASCTSCHVASPLEQLEHLQPP